MFKIKPKRERLHTSIQTVDGKHRDYVRTFQRKKELLPRKKDKLTKFEKELTKINNMDKSKYTNETIKRRSELKTEINKYKEEIFDIENNISEIDYYTLTEDLLVDYYDILEDEKIHDEHKDSKIVDISKRKLEKKQLSELDILNMRNKTKKKVKKPTKTRYKKSIQTTTTNNIMNFFNQSDNKQNDKNDKEDKEDNKENNKEDNSKIDTSTKKLKKATILDKFLTLVDKEYSGSTSQSKISITTCNNCGGEKKPIASDGVCVCIDCGETEMIIIESDKPNYKDPIPEKSGYPYKRQNHFQEWLSQFQAKESTEIPKEVFDKVIKELKKNKIYDWDNLTLIMMKGILKKLELNNYYEHIPHIISKLSGLPPPTITRETEETLRSMFKEIQEPFERHCPKERVNFLSYSYVLHKFCELLELDDFITCFPLLKNRDKLRQQDKIWKKICSDLLWQYIPSV
ncbi:MAG: hypothetical protein CMF62_00300 [Magnetococcales bacterium]|nr:hypothetical protein [Magnetococcales bacterium]|tara:strand:+ start:10524 stop:11897 length:1374 start_codon:yes stop_codon:yes gene_type:complete